MSKIVHMCMAAVVNDLIPEFEVEFVEDDIVLSMSASRSMIKLPRSTSGQSKLSVSNSKLFPPTRDTGPD